MKRELICIGCPMGCQLTAEVENGVVTSVSGTGLLLYFFYFIFVFSVVGAV